MWYVGSVLVRPRIYPLAFLGRTADAFQKDRQGLELHEFRRQLSRVQKEEEEVGSS